MLKEKTTVKLVIYHFNNKKKLYTINTELQAAVCDRGKIKSARKKRVNSEIKKVAGTIFQNRSLAG